MKTDKQLDRISVFLCKVLRHDPELLNLNLTVEGFIDIDRLLQAMSDHGTPITREELDRIVATDQKTRYTVDFNMIRCNQGHSTKQVSLTFTAGVPPANLYHGTTSRHRDSIRRHGLITGGRHYVHLSTDIETAKQVGRRHVRSGEDLVIYQVAAQISCINDGTYFLSDNGVWLTKHVDPRYLAEIKHF